jgi:hypothetical protein
MVKRERDKAVNEIKTSLAFLSAYLGDYKVKGHQIIYSLSSTESDLRPL